MTLLDGVDAGLERTDVSADLMQIGVGLGVQLLDVPVQAGREPQHRAKLAAGQRDADREHGDQLGGTRMPP